ncbi:DUF6338 family protein [Kocuria sp.]|uniref:DUF6338 family protein n=1 Tax=Kocuria sp. TaxID=1871328 RepID=UPI0025BF332E|nr:DUF6338 family protein [Kocuria sp.]
MTPSNLATLLAFLFLVAPGLFADLLEARRRAGAKESAFREVGRVALFSLVCSAAGAFVVGPVLAWLQRWTGFNPFLAVKDPSYAHMHFWWSVTSVMTTSAIGCGVAWAIQRWRLGPLWRSVLKISAWTEIFEIPTRSEALPQHENKITGNIKGRIRNGVKKKSRSSRIVKVELLTGEQYVGVLAGFTPNLEQADRELTLAQPLWVQRPNTDRPNRVPEEWEQLVLRGDQIKAVASQKHVSKTTLD